MHDLVIRNGTVVDGTGGPARKADIAIDDGMVTLVGVVDDAGTEEFDASGRIVSPGWVDIHTHYDGQVTWDPEVSPSSWHGVTTLVMGNCGVGFAPVRPGLESYLIDLMEGVEDIPGSALAEGIDWQWETFPEYLDAIDAMPRVLDIAAQVPHAALRAYVMGTRAHEEPTDDEIEQMAVLAGEALRAGAVGFSTSRTILHRSKYGLVPGTHATPKELLRICDEITSIGSRVVELAGDDCPNEAEHGWIKEVAERTGATVTYALAQGNHEPDAYKAALATAAELNDRGLKVIPQVSNRPTGMLFGLQSSFHPFSTHPTYREIQDLSLEERVEYLRQPEVRERITTEGTDTKNRIGKSLMTRWDQMFPLNDPPDYEPDPSSSVAAVAERESRRPEEVVLDWMLERGGKSLVFAPLASYAAHNHDAIREMITDPNTVLGLSDGGAHCGLICDASMPTYLLTHWTRDRHRGQQLGLEEAIAMQTSRTAAVFGFDDRGTLEPGKRADINVIDLERLRLHEPEMIFDLPADGRRLVQRVDGYEATFVTGVKTYDNGEPTGNRPGRLVRAR